MINFLRGIITHKSDQHLVVDVNGVGFGIQVPQEHLYKLHETVTLQVHMHWYQDQGPVLFGFTTDQERILFKSIVACSGMGPKVGLALLAGLTPQELIRAVSQNNIKALSAVHGIGPKKAENLIMQLKNKLDQWMDTELAATDKSLVHIRELTEALGALNYSKAEVHQAIDYLKQQESSLGSASFDELMRKALGYLAKRPRASL